MPYRVDWALQYAHRWAYDRNPQYYDFHSIGGDCTNFISQCLFAGGCVMNYTPVMGWYYNTADDRAAAWTGVEFLYNFLTTNQGTGPYGYEAALSAARPGDVIQLRFGGSQFSHSLLVVQLGDTPEEIEIATHSMNADHRLLSSYTYEACRLICIEGGRP